MTHDRLSPAPELVLGPELGRGAHTLVHRARRGGQDYAVKVLHRLPVDPVAAGRAFRREAALLAGVEHPALVPRHDVGELDGRPYLVMDLVDGRTLARELIASGPLPLEQVLHIGQQLAEALHAAHRVGLTHRDVKPANVMIGKDGQPRLIDFGLAGDASGLDVTDNDLSGTIGYASPEQCGVLTRPVDARSDLYSLGVVLYECLTGVPPFAADEAGELVRLHAFAAAPDVRALRPETSTALAEVVAALLAKDPDDRYQSGAGLAEDLAALADGASDLGALRGRRRRRVVPLAELGLLGRSAELATVVGHWRRTRSGNGGGVVAVVGGPGSGRTRLLDAVRDTCEAGPGTVLRLTGRATTGSGAALRRALDDWATDVEQLTGDAAEVGRALLVEAAAGLELTLGELSPVLARLLGVAVTGRGRLDAAPSAVAALVERLGRAAGACLVLVDNAEELDPVSVRVIRCLAELDPAAGVLAVVSGSDPATTTPRLVDVVQLQGLSEADVTELVQSVLGGVPAGLAERLWARSGGNPGAVLEQLRAANDAGLLTRSWGVWKADLAGLDALDLPSDALDLLLRRVGELDAPTRAVLTCIAAAETAVSTEVLARATEIDLDGVRAGLARAADQAVVEQRGNRLVLADPRLASALVDALAPAQRRELHQRLGDAFDEACGEPSDAPVDSAQLRAAALHLSRGHVDRDPLRVVDRCTAAGAAAVRELGWADALLLLDTAREIALMGDVPEPPALAEALGQVHLAAGRSPEAERELRRALDGTTEAVARAELLVLMASMHVTSFDHEASEAVLDEAFAGLRPSWVPRWVPKVGSPAALLASALLLRLLALIVAVTGCGRGSATGARRDRHRVVAALCVVGNQNSIYAFRPLRGLCWQWRAHYAVTRTGPCPEYVAVLTATAVSARLFRLHRLSRRHFGRARAAAVEPGSAATLDFYTAVAEHMADADDAALDRVLREQGQLLDTNAYVDGLSIRICQELFAGRLHDARAWYDRGALRLAASPVPGDALMMFGLSIAETLGTTDEASQALLFDVPLGPSRGLNVNLLLTQAYVLLERGDVGPLFDRVCDDFTAMRVPARALLPVQRQIHTVIAHGRCEQARSAEDLDRGARTREAERAVRRLRRLAKTPVEKAHLAVLRADLQQQRGNPRAALDAVAATARLLRDLDAPVVEYELARVAARALADLRRSGASSSYASMALQIAHDQSWSRRAQWVRTEFGVSAVGTASTTSTNRTSASSVAVSRYRERFAALEQISRAASRVLDPGELACVVLDETVRILGAERAFLFLCADNGVLTYAHGRDAHAVGLDEPSDYASSLVERVRQTREPVVVTGTDDGIALGSQSVVAHGLRSILVAPLQLDGRVLGVIYVDSRVAQGIFTRDDAAVLLAITTQVAASLETARAAQLAGAVLVAREQRDLAELLRATMERLSGTLSPAEVLERLGDAAGELTDATVVQLSETDGGLPEQIRTGGADDVPRPLLARVSEVGAPALQSWMEVPLRTRQHAVGVLRLGSDRPDGFSRAGGAEVVGALVGQAVVAYENAVLFTKVQELATTDGLTGVTNRAHAVQIAARHLREAAVQGTPVSAIMLDIDHFKLVNDTHGHQVGDEVIRTVADRLRAALRAEDLLARYGGEEFVALLVDSPDADAVAERLRLAVRATPIPTSAGALPVTVSVGISHYSGPSDTLDLLLGRADAGMYDAKRSGRDRVGAVD